MSSTQSGQIQLLGKTIKAFASNASTISGDQAGQIESELQPQVGQFCRQIGLNQSDLESMPTHPDLAQYSQGGLSDTTWSQINGLYSVTKDPQAHGVNTDDLQEASGSFAQTLARMATTYDISLPADVKSAVGSVTGQVPGLGGKQTK